MKSRGCSSDVLVEVGNSFLVCGRGSGKSWAGYEDFMRLVVLKKGFGFNEEVEF